MDLYTTVLRKSAGYWVALCLENGLVGQGINQELAIKQLNEAIASFVEVYKIEPNIYHTLLNIE
ncbi:type II toxin-antitoxin system HicB family antitoxin [Nostoc sp.]|uniref:type II toxin-antitoxin system HicB family antitoxin n=1 Tax=Nostoc sp. TaxID=1180 RepID=UPI002FF4BA5F